MPLSLPPVYPITDRKVSGVSTHAELVTFLCRGGATLIQMREKEMSDRDLMQQAREATAAAKTGGARLILNDRVDIAHLAGAHGVHLGDQDLPPAAARAILGDEAIIGVSTHGVEEAVAACRLPVDYIALGPVFATSHSAVERKPLGLEAVRLAAARLTLPLVAIGGMTPENARDVLRAGAASVAVIGGIMSAEDISRRVRDFPGTR